MNIHAKILANALKSLSINDYNSYHEDYIIKYKSDELKIQEFRTYDRLKKYSLIELRELAYLILTHERVSSNKSTQYKIRLAINFIEKDLFEKNISNDDYYKLLNEHNELKNKYDKLKNIMNE
jgi:hypothetical protein